MGEKYYVPPAFEISDIGLLSVHWVDDSYRVFNGCVDRAVGSELDFIEVSPWGFTRDVGSTFLSSTTRMLETDGCTLSDSRISTISGSRSLMDAPNFAPYEPFYFLGFLMLSLFVFYNAFRLIVGKGYK